MPSSNMRGRALVCEDLYNDLVGDSEEHFCLQKFVCVSFQGISFSGRSAYRIPQNCRNFQGVRSSHLHELHMNYDYVFNLH